MTQPISRRAFTRAALQAATGAALMQAALPASAAPLPTPTTPPAPNEGDALAQAVPGSAGYAPTPAQAEEVVKALKGYPGDFAKARVYHLESDIAPAVVPLPPLPAARQVKKGRAK